MHTYTYRVAIVLDGAADPDVPNGGTFLFLVGGQTLLHGTEIGGRIDVCFGVNAVRSVLVTGVISGGEFSGNRKSDFALDAQQILSHLQSHVSHFAPILAPAVANDPVLRSGLAVAPPSNNGNDVIRLLGIPFLGVDATGVFDNGFRVDGGRHGTTGVDFRHDAVNGSVHIGFVVVDEPVLGNGGVGKVFEGNALAAHPSKGIAGLAGVLGGAGGIDLAAKSLGGFRAARQVRGAGIVRDVSGLLNKLVRAGVLQECE